MFLQWCVKGISARLDGEPPEAGIDDAEAAAMLAGGQGIRCNWYRNVHRITQQEILSKLTALNLDRHIHDYDRYKADTPFISLTAGSVERDTALRTNRIYEAQDIALRFATNWGERPGYLFYCWMMVGLKPAVSVRALAEEVRHLHTYTRYSNFQLEGEIAAKINIPSNQIHSCERWDVDGSGGVHAMPAVTIPNPRFDDPGMLSNLREML